MSQFFADSYWETIQADDARKIMLRDERHFTGHIFPVGLECTLDEEMRRIDREEHEFRSCQA